jgi:selenocysteine lyase/cysteine desulfurase
VHRGAGYKSQLATAAYEDAREAIRCFAGRSDRDDVAIICRNTTEAINHLAYRLPLRPTDMVLTTVVEHHANLLPRGRVATRGFIECDADGPSKSRRSAGKRSETTTPRSRARSVRWLSSIPGVRLLGPGPTPTRFRSPPLSSTGSHTRSWPPG